ncbi:MAG: MdtA/MuxA family multidrug efflux RND transporter periplasmic adaptor subunit [Burkholderiales bacterium]
MRRILPWAIALGAVAATVGTGAYFYQQRPTETAAKMGKGGFGKGLGNVPVVAVPAGVADVGVQLEGLGTVTPVATVTVRSRVDGQLMRLAFKEGQIVRAGELLAEIDPRPAQVQLATAEGQFAKDLSLLKNAQIDLERYRTLFGQDSIAKQQLDTQEALVRQYEATLKVDQAAIESARLQLSYTRITAPIGGRLGLRQVDLGNIVRAGDANGLVVITQLLPITVVFSIPEDSLPPVMKKLKAGDQLAVAAFDRGGKTQLATGALITVDNQIDPATGTVKLKAQFANDDLALFPNQFVNVRLLVDTKARATVVPVAAIQRGTPGTFVYAVDGESKVVSVRKLRLGPVQGQQVVVEEGVAPGTLVVVDGADQLREGAVVEMVVRGSEPARESATIDERLKRWQALNARIDKGEFGEEIRKLPEEERKKRMRELRAKKPQ